MRTLLEPVRQRGLTLIELIVAIVIIGVCVAGVMAVFNEAVRGSANPMMVKQSYAIAEALMEEVQLAPFTQCDPSDPLAETGVCTPGFVPPAGARPFDHVLKYNGMALNPVSGIDGAPIPNLAAYSATVTVAAGTLNTILPATGDAVLITVTVAAPNGVYTLQGWRTRYAPTAVP